MELKVEGEGTEEFSCAGMFQKGICRKIEEGIIVQSDTRFLARSF